MESTHFVIGRSWVQLPLSAPVFSTLLPFNQFTFPFSVRAENSETLGNTKPATFATARFCDSGIVLLSSVFVARLAGQIFYIPDFALRRYLPGVD